MSILTEGRHAGEFLATRAPGTLSFETATVKSGENLVAGQIISLDVDGKIVATPASLDSADALDTAADGILWNNVDASATGANADVPDQVYVARDAEYVDSSVTYPTETSPGGERAATITSLARLGIRPLGRVEGV